MNGIFTVQRAGSISQGQWAAATLNDSKCILNNLIGLDSSLKLLIIFLQEVWYGHPKLGFSKR